MFTLLATTVRAYPGAPRSPGDLEGSRSGRGGVAHRDVAHARGGRPPAQPRDHVVDRVRLALDVRRDAAVGLVAHPPGHAEALGRVLRLPPERDTLDAAADAHLYRGRAHGSIMVHGPRHPPGGARRTPPRRAGL